MEHTKTGATRTIAASAVFSFIGAETSHRGVFAGGDVRHGSVKRVASAVGEGAMAIMFIHQHLRRDTL